MRREKGTTGDYKMVSVPGKTGGALEGMSAARLRQELEALRESEVQRSDHTARDFRKFSHLWGLPSRRDTRRGMTTQSLCNALRACSALQVYAIQVGAINSTHYNKVPYQSSLLEQFEAICFGLLC